MKSQIWVFGTLSAKPLDSSSLGLMTVISCSESIQRAVVHLHLFSDRFVPLTREYMKIFEDVGKAFSRTTLLSTFSLLIGMPLLSQTGWSWCMSYVPITSAPLLWAAARITLRIWMGMYVASSMMITPTLSVRIDFAIFLT